MLSAQLQLPLPLASPMSRRPAARRSPGVPGLPATSPLPGCGGAGETLPLAWVYRAVASSLPADASVEVEAIELIAAAAGEFLALVAQRAAVGGGGSGCLDAAATLRALRELGYGWHERALYSFWTAQAQVGGCAGAGAASAGTGVGARGDGAVATEAAAPAAKEGAGAAVGAHGAEAPAALAPHGLDDSGAQ